MEQFEVFSIVRAEINPQVVRSIKSPDKYWRDVEEKVDVKILMDSIFNKVEVQGSWNQIGKIKDMLIPLLHKPEFHHRDALVDDLLGPYAGSETGVDRSSDSIEGMSMVSGVTMNTQDLLNYRVSPEPDHPKNRSKAYEKQAQVVCHDSQNRHEHASQGHMDFGTYEHEESISRDTASPTQFLNDNIKEPDESMQVDTDIFDYLKKFEKNKLDRIKLSNRVEIKWEECEDVTIISIQKDMSLKSGSLSNAIRAKEELISLYQWAYLSLKVELIDTADVHINHDIVVGLMETHPLCLVPVIARASKSHELCLIGISDDVQEASRLVLEKLGLYLEPIDKNRKKKKVPTATLR